MSSPFYGDSIENFLHQNENEIFGIIAKNDEYDSVFKQKDAWIAQIQLLKMVIVYLLILNNFQNIYFQF